MHDCATRMSVGGNLCAVQLLQVLLVLLFPCMTRGSVLFTELHDLGGAIAIVAPSTFIHAGTDKLPKANAWHDSLARNTCCHFRLSSESLGQHAHERRRTVLDYNSYNKMRTKPLDKTVDGGDGIAAGIAAIAQDVVQGRTIRTEVVDSVIDRGRQLAVLADSCIGLRGFSGNNACGGGQHSQLGFPVLWSACCWTMGKRSKLRHGLQNDLTGTSVHSLFEYADGATEFGNEAQPDNSGLGYPLLERLLLDDFRAGSTNGRGSRESRVVSS